MLTTIDNPYSPYTEYDLWMQWDQEHGYYTAEFLANLTGLNPDLDEEEVDELINETIDEIVRLNVLGVYIKV